MITLEPLKEDPSLYEELEAEISRLFKEEVYLPLIRVFGERKIENALDDLTSAIDRGKLTFHRGVFRGRLNSKVVRELRRVGATWDKSLGAYKIHQAKLPVQVKSAIDRSEEKFRRSMRRVDDQIGQILPKPIADRMRLEELIDSTMFKLDKRFQHSVKDLNIAPRLSEAEYKRITDEYTRNMQLYIQDWAKKEIVELRERMQERAAKGYRYESMIEEIERSYGVSRGKAKFLARQETSLLVSKYRQIRYEGIGSPGYIWGCVKGSPGHEVRPMHKRLEGKYFKWSEPPIVNEKGERKHPGQDFGCRCFPKPVVRF